MNRLARVLTVLVLVVALIGALGIAVANYAAKNRKTPPPSSIPTNKYSGILHKIEKKDGGGGWLTALVYEDKTIKRLEVGPKVFVSNLKVGQAVTLTVQNIKGSDKIVNILEMGQAQFAFIEGVIDSISEKTLIINWYNNKIAVSMGASIKLSHKIDTIDGKLLPGKQTTAKNFLSLTKGQFVYAFIDRATQSEELIVKSVAIVSDK